MTDYAKQATKEILSKVPGFIPRVGIILGSGLGDLAKQIVPLASIPYTELAGFPVCSVEGHTGSLLLGTLNGLPVACLQGRAHYYEGADYSIIKTLVRTLKLLGCETLLATNAAGSLRESVAPGELVLIHDHINFQFHNPLVGKNDGDFGPRFVGMENAYDALLRQQFMQAAANLSMTLSQGVYLGVLGPAFETPAEIRAYRLLGADVVGMSTVPEVIIARHAGMRVAVISAITNFAAGMDPTLLSHDVTLAGAALAAKKLIPLVLEFINHYE